MASPEIPGSDKVAKEGPEDVADEVREKAKENSPEITDAGTTTPTPTTTPVVQTATFIAASSHPIKKILQRLQSRSPSPARRAGSSSDEATAVEEAVQGLGGLQLGDPQPAAQDSVVQEPAAHEPTSQEPAAQEPADQEATVPEPAVPEPAVQQRGSQRVASQEPSASTGLLKKICQSLPEGKTSECPRCKAEMVGDCKACGWNGGFGGSV